MSVTGEAAHFLLEPDTEHPGWLRYELSDPDRYNRGFLGTLLVRREGDRSCRVRLTPRTIHLNSAGNIHGGTSLGLIDVALFVTMNIVCGVPISGSSTIDLQNQFIGAGSGALPLDAVVEVVRETGRMGFLRGLVVQEENIVGSFTATIRKPAARK